MSKRFLLVSVIALMIMCSFLAVYEFKRGNIPFLVLNLASVAINIFSIFNLTR